MRKVVAAVLAAGMIATPAGARCVGSDNVSWYGEPQKVRSGARYDPEAETCAHPVLPDGSILRITMDGFLPVDCQVNDWGPDPRTGCVVDVSRKLARRLGLIERGVGRARIEVVRRGP